MPTTEETTDKSKETKYCRYHPKRFATATKRSFYKNSSERHGLCQDCLRHSKTFFPDIVEKMDLRELGQ